MLQVAEYVEHWSRVAGRHSHEAPAPASASCEAVGRRHSLLLGSRRNSWLYLPEREGGGVRFEGGPGVPAVRDPCLLIALRGCTHQPAEGSAKHGPADSAVLLSFD